MVLAKAFVIGFFVSTAALAQDYTYQFPGCNGGGGNWPAREMTFSNNMCDSSHAPVLVRQSGHCNGYLDLLVSCHDTQVVDVEISDCFCD